MRGQDGTNKQIVEVSKQMLCMCGGITLYLFCFSSTPAIKYDAAYFPVRLNQKKMASAKYTTPIYILIFAYTDLRPFISSSASLL